MKPKMKRVNFDRVIGLLMIIFFTNVAALATYFYLNADFGAICLGMAFVLDGLSVVFVNELYHEVEQFNLHLIKIDYINKQTETLDMKADQVA